MNTEQIQTVAEALADGLEDRRLAVHPATGEAVDVRQLNGQGLAAAIGEANRLYGLLAEFKAQLVDEVARRADARGERTTEINGVKFEVNPPTEDTYHVEDLEANLQPLVEDGTIDQELLDALIVIPKPKPPVSRVDKRRLNAILKSDNRRLLSAIAQSRTRSNNKRTAKIISIVPTTTAEEV